MADAFEMTCDYFNPIVSIGPSLCSECERGKNRMFIQLADLSLNQYTRIHEL